MAQEFTINSSAIESKINQLLPSQGGSGAGVDFSASTMVIPIVDLTESAEGSNVRQDIQSSFSLNNTSSFFVENTTATLINTTGFWLITGLLINYSSSVAGNGSISITDGISSKALINLRGKTGTPAINLTYSFNYLVKLEAGDSITATSSSTLVTVEGIARQIATVDGNLINP